MTQSRLGNIKSAIKAAWHEICAYSLLQKIFLVLIIYLTFINYQTNQLAEAALYAAESAKDSASEAADNASGAASQSGKALLYAEEASNSANEASNSCKERY